MANSLHPDYKRSSSYHHQADERDPKRARVESGLYRPHSSSVRVAYAARAALPSPEGLAPMRLSASDWLMSRDRIVDIRRFSCKDIAMAIRELSFNQHLSYVNLENLTLFLQQVLASRPNGMDISMILLSMGKLSFWRPCAHLPYNASRALCELFLQLEGKEKNAQDISQASLGISKLLQNKSLSSLEPKRVQDLSRSLAHLVIELSNKPANRQSVSAQDICNSILSLSKFFEEDLLRDVPPALPDALRALLIRLPTTVPNPQAIANALLGIGKFVEYGFLNHLPGGLQEALFALLDQLEGQKAGATDQAISNTLLGMSKFVDKGLITHCPEGSKRALYELIVLLAKKNPTGQSIASALLGFSKFAEKELLSYLPRECEEAMCAMLEKMGQGPSLAIEIANAILGLGKIADKNMIARLPSRVCEALDRMVLRLSKMEKSNQDIGNTLLGISKVVEKNLYKIVSRDVFEAVCSLLIELSKRTLKSYHCSPALLGFGRFVFYHPLDMLTSQRRQELASGLCHMVREMATNCPEAISIGSALLGFGRAVEREVVTQIDSATAAALFELLNRLPQQELTAAQQISNSVVGLSKCVEVDLIKEFPASCLPNLMALAEALDSMHADEKSLSAFSFAFAKFFNKELFLSLLSEKDRLFLSNRICRELELLTTLEPDMQTIGLHIATLGVYSEKGIIKGLSARHLEALFQLFRRFYTLHYEKQEIYLVLQGLGKMVKNGHVTAFAEDIVKKIILLSSHLPPRETTAKALSGAALSLGRLAEKKVFQNLAEPDRQLLVGALLAMFSKLQTHQLTAKNIFTMLSGLSKFVDVDIISYLHADQRRNLLLMLDRLSRVETTSQDISITLLSIGKFVEKKLLKWIPDESFDALCALVRRLLQLPLSEQHISNALTGLSKMVEDAQMPLLPADICTCIEKMVVLQGNLAKNSQAISTTLLSLGKFALHDLFSELSSEAIQAVEEMVLKLDENEASVIAMSIALVGFSKLLDRKLIPEVSQRLADKLVGLFLKIVEKAPSGKYIGMALLAIAKCVEQGIITNVEQKIPPALISRVIALLHAKEIDSQGVPNSIAAFAKFLRASSAYQPLQQEMVPLASSCQSLPLDNLTICNVLYDVCESGVPFTLYQAIGLFEKLSFAPKSTHAILSLSEMVRGLYGFAMLANSVPTQAVIDKVLRLFTYLEKKRLYTSNLLLLIAAYSRLKENKIEAVADKVAIEVFMQKFLAQDPTNEEKEKVQRLLATLPLPTPQPDLQQVEEISGNFQPSPKTALTLTPSATPTTYDLDDRASVQALTAYYKARGVEYVPEAEALPLQVVPIAILGGEFGIVAKGPIAAQTILGHYGGDIVKGQKAIEKSAYAFELSNSEDEEEMLFVDASKKRNFAALFNHSFTPNIKPVLDKGKIALRVMEEEIQAGQQCFISYGQEFFPYLGFHPFYLDPQDGASTFDDSVLKEKSAYHSSPGKIRRELMAAFKLCTQEVLLTQLSEAILLGDETKALVLVDAQAHLWNYSTRAGILVAPREGQQRFSPLMLACYLGQMNVVRALLKKGFVNRQQLKTGDTAIFFALRGKAKDKNGLFQLLLEHGAYFNLTNSDGVSLLNIAVEENLPEVVEHLLNHPKNVRDELYDTFANCARDSLYEAMLKGHFEAIRVILGKATKRWLFPKIIEKEIMLYKAFEELQGDIAKFSEALTLWVIEAEIHKNFSIVQAIVERLGKNGLPLLDEALKAKKWTNKEKALLTSLQTTLLK